MGTSRTAAAGLLVVEAGIAAAGVLVHYGVTAEYGDVTASAVDGWTWGFTAGTGGVALVLVGVPGLAAVVASSRLWMRLAALGIPALMALGMLAVTPAALREKLDVQYSATPQCLSTQDTGHGPGSRAGRDSQAAFESIEHVGLFSGGGASGVGGCDRAFVTTGDADVLDHYRTVLPVAGWRIAEDQGHRLRAERDGQAFEVAVCGRGGVVWAGSVAEASRAGCHRDTEKVTG